MSNKSVSTRSVGRSPCKEWTRGAGVIALGKYARLVSGLLLLRAGWNADRRESTSYVGTGERNYRHNPPGDKPPMTNPRVTTLLTKTFQTKTPLDRCTGVIVREGFVEGVITGYDKTNSQHNLRMLSGKVRVHCFVSTASRWFRRRRGRRGGFCRGGGLSRGLCLYSWRRNKAVGQWVIWCLWRWLTGDR